MPIVLNGTTGITTPTYNGSTAAEYLVPVTAFKNRIINGAMTIDQRNAGASVSIASGGNPYTLDRFRSDNSTDGAITVQRVTDAPTGFVNSMKYTVTTADSSLASNQYLGLNQFIEGFNTADLMWGTANAKTITISFWVKSSITGNYPVSLDNNAATRYYIGQYSINSANTWEYKTITIAGDTSGTWNTDNERGVAVRWLLGSGSGLEGTVNSWQSGAKYTFSGAASVIGTLNATWFITGVQLEVGTNATFFDARPYTTELQLCQRYYYQVTGASGNNYEPFASGTADASTSTDVVASLPVTMRAVPTTSFTGNIFIYDGGSSPTLSSVANVFGGKTGVYLNLTTGSGLTQGRGTICYTNNASNSNFVFSAEL